MNNENNNIKNIIINGINYYNIPINNYETLRDIRKKLSIKFTNYFLDKYNQIIDVKEEDNKLAIDCLKNNKILELKSDLKRSIIFFNNDDDDENQNYEKKQIKNKKYLLINKSNNERQKIYSINENEKLSEIRRQGNF